MSDRDGHGRFGAGNKTGFAKGESGNPGGAPKGIVNRLREKHHDDVFKVVEALKEIALDPDEKAKDRTAASVAFLNRILGAPTQIIEATMTDGPRIDWDAMDVDKRRQLLALMHELGLLDGAGDASAPEH